MTSVGFDLQGFVDFLYSDPMFSTNIKIQACEYSIDSYLSPGKQILISIIKNSYLIYNLNIKKKEIALTIDNNKINDINEKFKKL